MPYRPKTRRGLEADKTEGRDIDLVLMRAEGTSHPGPELLPLPDLRIGYLTEFEAEHMRCSGC